MEDRFLKPLTEVEVGRKVLVVALLGGRECQCRLVDLGLRVGQEVRVLCRGNGCDGPMLVAAGETRLAVGHGMAGKIMVVNKSGGPALQPCGASIEDITLQDSVLGMTNTEIGAYRRKELHEQGCTERVDKVGEALRLSDYLQGQKGRIIRVQGDDESRRRMSEMGFTKGIEVKVVKAAPLTDPVEYLLKGYHVSLRREQAAHILMDRPNVEARDHE